jgi:DNA polymerase IV
MALKFPPIYLLKTRFQNNPDELHRLEKEIGVVWDIREAKLVLGIVSTKQRAIHDLRYLGLETDEVVRVKKPAEDSKETKESPERVDESFELPSRKRRKLEWIEVNGKDVIALHSSMESEGSDAEKESGVRRESPSIAQSGSPVHVTSSPPAREPPSFTTSMASQAEMHPEIDEDKIIRVLKLAWYTDSLKVGTLLPYDKYLIYEGIPKPPQPSNPERKATRLPHSGSSILSQARADTPPAVQTHSHSRFHPSGKGRSQPPKTKTSRHSQLLHEDTEEHEITANLPPVPEWLKTRYSCQRPTPLHSPNDGFISQLKIIRQARKLESNEVNGYGFADKAYSGAIATIASYPYTITSVAEILRLPGCSEKMAGLWQEWKENGRIKEVDEIESDERMKSLNIFYNIYGVGEHKAREFYGKGWKDLDDVIQYGWDHLTREQQIGVKFYDDLQLRIPREEVERTGEAILSHANKICPGFQMVIVGGYRRGKPDSGDMDFILSHPDEDATGYFLDKLLDSLGHWISYLLTVSTRTSDRGQETLSWRGDRPKSEKRGPGFDTLDHAFVVWQDPNFDGQEGKEEGNNPNPHRRVDIIISPWKTAGCAVLGWSGGTMFERDLRSYCRKEMGWKFDSSGVRVVDTGEWVDLEGSGEVTLEEKERRVFEGLKLEWREPTERCTH